MDKRDNANMDNLNADVGGSMYGSAVAPDTRIDGKGIAGVAKYFNR